MFDLAAIRAGLAANLATLATAEGLQVSEYELSNPTLGTISIAGVENIDYAIAMQRGGDTADVLVRAVVAVVSDIGSQKRLDRMMASSGASSIKTAIESDPQLGDTIDDLFVRACSGHQFYPQVGGTGEMLGAVWTVQIETSH